MNWISRHEDDDDEEDEDDVNDDDQDSFDSHTSVRPMIYILHLNELQTNIDNLEFGLVVVTQTN